MADCYIVRRGGTGENNEKGIIDLTNKDCIINMINTWLFADGSDFTTNGYIAYTNAHVVGSYNNLQVGISVKYNYPTDFDISKDGITTYSSGIRVYGYNLKNAKSIRVGPYTYYTGIFTNDIFISEDVECKYPEIKKHFGTWHNYRDLRYIDVVKYPAQNNGNVFTDYIIMKQVYNSNTWLTTLALKNPSIVRINTFDTAPKAKLQIAAEYICYYTHSVSDYDPSIKLNNEYTNNPDRSWYFDDADTVLNGVAFTTCDILYEDGTLAMKANCTLDEVIQKE